MRNKILSTENQNSKSDTSTDPNEKILRTVIVSFLIAFSGWTIATQISVLAGWNLQDLLILAPFVITLLITLFIYLTKKNQSRPLNKKSKYTLYQLNFKYAFHITLITLIAVPAALYLSWTAFWILSTLLLAANLITPAPIQPLRTLRTVNPGCKLTPLVIPLVIVIAIIVSYAVSRTDADDAFYVAVAAFHSSHPEHSLLAGDPMLGDPALPLIFPSYRFASFELLSGAIAHLLSVASMDVYYIYLLPVWAIASLSATFLLTKELMPKSWILAGVLTFILTLILGEMHRGTANFAFVRLFQGKAVFLSVIVPAIFYLTARYFSDRGTRNDLFLLACCQVTAIGLSNFGMLAAPIAGFAALASNIPLALKSENKKLFSALTILFIPLPYLITVALQLNGSPMMDYGTEAAENVWASIFGPHQQYLIGILLLAGPTLAKDIVTKWRLAVPPFIYFTIYINPWLSEFISLHITTPPVYWRMIWSFPMLAFCAISACMIATELFNQKPYRLLLTLLSAIVLGLTAYSLPFHTLRADNIGKIENFASWKIPDAHLLIAKKGIAMAQGDGMLLAPEEIASVISRFEQHPRLVSTRAIYLDLLRPALGVEHYPKMRALYDFVSGIIEGNGELAQRALQSEDVSLIIISIKNEGALATSLLTKEGYKKQDSTSGYSFWKKTK
ncbi:DUF6077 domain-containing protein [Pseudomonas rustica]|uniref:DUF6077 domain-containing protein n=1 Tax=Pseudomonas rustica TaxID=2827099 RepID=UPI003CF2BC73